MEPFLGRQALRSAERRKGRRHAPSGRLDHDLNAGGVAAISVDRDSGHPGTTPSHRTAIHVGGGPLLARASDRRRVSLNAPESPCPLVKGIPKHPPTDHEV